jgi:hypothetical protein
VTAPLSSPKSAFVFYNNLTVPLKSPTAFKEIVKEHRT